MAHTLEAFALHEGRWTGIGLFQEQDLVTVEPFTAVALELGGLWADVDESKRARRNGALPEQPMVSPVGATDGSPL